jgi:hypothetical protein
MRCADTILPVNAEATMIRHDDLNWRVFCEVVRKESGHDLSLYVYLTGERYWAECSRCYGAGNIISGFDTVDQAMEMWRHKWAWDVKRGRRCNG